jgi:hypothetical protein
MTRRGKKGTLKTGFGPGFADFRLVTDSRKIFKAGKCLSGSQMSLGPERNTREEGHGKAGKRNPARWPVRKQAKQTTADPSLWNSSRNFRFP